MCQNVNKSSDLDFESDKNAYFSMDWYGDIINAISRETILETNPSCPTGNCTFPVFSSLAFCSNCVDVTQSLQQNSNCSQNEGWNMKTEIDKYENVSTSFPQKTMSCTFRLPLFSSDRNYSYPDDLDENSSFTVSWDVRKDEQPVANAHDAPLFLNVLLPSHDFSERFQSSDGKNISSHFTAMALIKFAPQADSARVGFVRTAHVCALSVCAKEYNMSMTSGLFRSEIVSTSYSEFDGPTIIDQKNTGNPSYRFSFSDDLNNNFTVDSYLTNTISIPIIYNKTISNDSIFGDPSSGDPSSGDPISGDSSSSHPSSVRPISLDVGSGNPISGYAISGDPISGDPISTVAFSFEEKMTEVLQKAFEGILRSNYDLSMINNWFANPRDIYLSGLNTSTNIPKTMDRVTAAMSNRLRDISNITVEGQSGSMELYVRVSWWWLLLPTSTVVFATFFLISITITTRKHKVPIWKTSELTLLFHGLDLSSLGGDSIEMLKASEMEDIASVLRVRFDRDSERGGMPKLERVP